MGEKTKRNTTHIEIQGHAEDRQQPQNTIEPTDTPMEPILRPCCQRKCALPIPFLFPARQRMQEKVKDIDRQKGDAVEQERLERIRADLGIAAYTQSTNRRAKKKGRTTDVPSHESDDDVPPESVHETTPCPADLQPEGVVEGEKDRVGSSRGRISGCWRRSRCLWRVVTSTVSLFVRVSQDGLPHRNGKHASVLPHETRDPRVHSAKLNWVKLAKQEVTVNMLLEGMHNI